MVVMHTNKLSSYQHKIVPTSGAIFIGDVVLPCQVLPQLHPDVSMVGKISKSADLVFVSRRRHCSRTSQCLILNKVVSRFRVCKSILSQEACMQTH